MKSNAGVRISIRVAMGFLSLLVSAFAFAANEPADEAQPRPEEAPAPKVDCTLSYSQKEFRKGAVLSEAQIAVSNEIKLKLFNGFRVKTLLAKSTSQFRPTIYKLFASLSQGAVRNEIEVTLAPGDRPQMHSTTLVVKNEKVVLSCIDLQPNQAP